MNRKALIITNPGEKGDEHYCKGVLRDADNYLEYLQSPVGGSWDYPTEIVTLPRPTTAKLRQELKALCKLDYSLIIFSGHAGYPPNSDSLLVELQAGEDIEATEFQCGVLKRTVILDCCRTPIIPILEEKGMEVTGAMQPTLDLEECKQYYNQEIEDCTPGIIIAYSCSKDHVSYDSGKGGIYSTNLIARCRSWASSKNVVALRKNGKYSALSIVKAHMDIEEAVKHQTLRFSEGQQEPDMLKPRDGKYFPFAIVV